MVFVLWLTRGHRHLRSRCVLTLLVHTEAVRKTRTGAEWAARERRTVTRERDPIFAAIDRCRQADATFVAASHRFDETGTVQADTAAKKAVAAFAAARLTLARTVPTTPAGLAAIMGFVSSNGRVRAHLLRRRQVRP